MVINMYSNIVNVFQTTISISLTNKKNIKNGKFESCTAFCRQQYIIHRLKVTLNMKISKETERAKGHTGMTCTCIYIICVKRRHKSIKTFAINTI